MRSIADWTGLVEQPYCLGGEFSSLFVIDLNSHQLDTAMALASDDFEDQ
jgi:hypothetical protein